METELLCCADMKPSPLLSSGLLLFVCNLLFACSSSGEEEGPSDAGPDGGVNVPKAQEVNCTANVTKEVTTRDNPTSFVPMSLTVTQGTVVRFKMGASHDARSSERLFTIAEGETKCVQFNLPGTYQFTCFPHGFTGNIVVQ
jgi:plastocyanin